MRTDFHIIRNGLDIFTHYKHISYVRTCTFGSKMRCSNTRILVVLIYSSFIRHVFVNQTMYRLKGVKKGNRYNSTTVIAKIKEMQRSLFYHKPRYVTMGYEM